MSEHLWDVYRDGAWWNAPPAQMFQAYYMTLRVHYGMPASEAFERAKENREALAIGQPLGIVGKIREALQ